MAEKIIVGDVPANSDPYQFQFFLRLKEAIVELENRIEELEAKHE